MFSLCVCELCRYRCRKCRESTSKWQLCQSFSSHAVLYVFALIKDEMDCTFLLTKKKNMKSMETPCSNMMKNYTSRGTNMRFHIFLVVDFGQMTQTLDYFVTLPSYGIVSWYWTENCCNQVIPWTKGTSSLHDEEQRDQVWDLKDVN